MEPKEKRGVQTEEEDVPIDSDEMKDHFLALLVEIGLQRPNRGELKQLS